MAKYPAEQFEEAAKVYFEKYGLVPTPEAALEQVVDTKANAAALATELGADHVAHKGLTRVATLRDSIAKRFIRLSVAPLAQAQTPRQRQASKAKEATPAAQPSNRQARRRRGKGQPQVAASA